MNGDHNIPDHELYYNSPDLYDSHQYLVNHEEIIHKMLSIEQEKSYGPGYCCYEPPSKINISQRRKIINWLRDISNNNHCEPDSLSFALLLLDRYMKNTYIVFEQYHLAAAACYDLSNRIRGINQVTVQDLIQHSDGNFTAQQLFDYEEQIILIVNFDMIGVNPLDFFDPLSQLADLNEDDTELLRQTAVNIYIICIHCCVLSEFRPSIIASACLMACMEMDFGHLPQTTVKYIELLTSLMNLTDDELRRCYDHVKICIDKGDPVDNDVGCDQEILDRPVIAETPDDDEALYSSTPVTLANT